MRELMVHSGYEASAVNETFGSLRGFAATVRATLFDRYSDSDIDNDTPMTPRKSQGPLVPDWRRAERITPDLFRCFIPVACMFDSLRGLTHL